MKFEFEYEKGSANRFGAFIFATQLVIILSAFFFFHSDPTDYMLFILWVMAMMVLMIAIIIKPSLYYGYILCLSNQNSIAVCRGHRQRIIPIEDIERVSCLPEITYGKYSVKHMLVFTVILKTGKKLVYYAKLDIDKDMPVRQPEKFKEYIAEQPMMKLYEYINKCLGAEQYE